MFLFSLRRASSCCFILLLLLAFPLHSVFANPPAQKFAEGVDVEFGGYGNGHGTFKFLRDFAFGPKNRIYALDGAGYDYKTKAMTGNLLVQIFSHKGKFLREFPIVAPQRVPSTANPVPGMEHLAGIYNDPQCLAVDALGNVFITQPRANMVQIYNNQGQLTHQVAISAAMAITPWHGDMAVIGSANEVVPNRGWSWIGGRRIDVINAAGHIVDFILLSHRLTQVESMASDSRGDFYCQAAVNQIEEFSPQGQLMRVLGCGSRKMFRQEDGSELIHSVAVDQHGNIYSMTFGNPGRVTKFNASMTTVTQHRGEFSWADAWNANDLPIHVDANGRVWVASTGALKPSNRWYHRFAAYPSPCIMRLRKDFFKPGMLHVHQHSALALGLFPSITTSLPCSIAYNLHPVPITFHIGPANRPLQAVRVAWKVFNLYKQLIAHGEFNLPLVNGKPAQHNLAFTPPRFGWYMVQIGVYSGSQRLMTLGKFVGVTPPFADLPQLKKGMIGTPWQYAFAGQPIMRLSPGAGVGKTLVQAKKAGVTVFFNLTNIADCTPAKVRADVLRYRGRVKYWEIMNEPNFSMSPAAYVAMIKKLYPLIKRLYPAAQVIGPDVCGIQLPWYKQFYEDGGKNYTDILSIHDYEGNESIDPVHWRWKIGALRKLMAHYGDAAKPIWNTERAITGIRGGDFLPATQAIRDALHQNLMCSLGIPNRHDCLYYMNNMGYSAVPSFEWSSAGPHPAALALRTRAAMIGRRKLAQVLNFGSTGNNLLLGLRYAGKHGSTIVLQNLGAPELRVVLAVKGQGSIQATDSFGNTIAGIRVQREHDGQGMAVVHVGQMPIYLLLTKGESISVPQLNLGTDLARLAKFTYSAKCTNLPALNNGVWNTYMAGGPYGGTNAKGIFWGDLPTVPQYLTMQFATAQTIGEVVVAGLRADNGYCALLDYNLQYQKAGHWITIQRVRTELPASEWVRTPDCIAATWYKDSNCYFNSFAPVATTALRLVVLRSTFGFAPDALANEAIRRTWGGPGNKAKLCLRQIQIYAPAPHLRVQEINAPLPTNKKAPGQ